MGESAKSNAYSTEIRPRIARAREHAFATIGGRAVPAVQPRADRLAAAGQPRVDVISRISLQRWIALATLVLLFGAAAGTAGGLVALQLRDDPGAVATAGPTPEAPATAVAEGQQLRDALDEALPAIVTVLADLPDEPQPDGRVLERQNIGSGVVVSDQGHVITNYHVVEGAEVVTVVLSTGEHRPARLVADDSPYHDMAVLRVDPRGLRAIEIGDSEALRLGDRVAAIAGGLVNFENQVKVGVVSATGIDFPRQGVVLRDMLQTDAAINHGDSGGALVNLQGELVGLITTVVRQTPAGETVEGVALVHSSNSLRPVVEAVLATGGNPRPRYGIERVGSQHLPVTPELATEQGLPVPAGALIIDVAEGSAAADAGVLPGDVVVGVNGISVDTDRPLVNLLEVASAGPSAELTIMRDREQLAITVTPFPRSARKEALDG
ncbi:MAG: trypsin-like serine protease [Dehalococcoidia bacterium]|nr:trypsin-like serine protease [Dehalococcoidia bacterium]